MLRLQALPGWSVVATVHHVNVDFPVQGIVLASFIIQAGFA